MAGALPLNEAYDIARQRRDAASSEESRLAELRTAHPELADKVVEGELTLAGALAEARKRDARVNETLGAHAADFQTQERCSLDELLAACERAHHYLPEPHAIGERSEGVSLRGRSGTFAP
jgi:hypothetical protein